MRYAIIAAGEGSRLANEGIVQSKPMVSLCGTPLVERMIKIFAANEAESICIVINSKQPDTLALLQRLQKEYPVEIIVKDTPSSMHSLHAMSKHLRGGKFCLTTVDTVFCEQDFAKYIKQFQASNVDAMMAVTEYIDDEKPLYIATDSAMHITDFLDTPPANPKYISGGIYGLTDKALDVLEHCIEAQQSRMRNFQRSLIAEGLDITAHPFGKIIDIDHADDIRKAEHFIASK